jgi:threonine dehydratase
LVELPDIERARPAVRAIGTHTPIFNSRVLSELIDAPVVYKAENLQRTGSFKIRGAASKLASLGERAKVGVVVASAGNHAQAVAFAAREAGVSCDVFMPAAASVLKYAATVSYGADVRLGGESLHDCLEMATAYAKETGKILVHPFDDEAIIAGQGTLGLELVEDVEDLAAVVVPLGGGGLAAGTALAVKSLRPEVRVVAVQAAEYAPWPASLAEGRPVTVESAPTLADGIAVRRPGELTLPLVARYVDEVVTVSEDSIADAMVILLERAKLVVEGAGAVGFAAIWGGGLDPAPKRPGGGRGTTAVVLSGGNVDIGVLAPAISRHETHAGRRLALFARVPDTPGSLAKLLENLGRSGANLVTVDHVREGFALHARETGLLIVLETRDPEHASAVVEAAKVGGFEVEVTGHVADWKDVARG